MGLSQNVVFSSQEIRKHIGQSVSALHEQNKKN